MSIWGVESESEDHFWRSGPESPDNPGKPDNI